MPNIHTHTFPNGFRVIYDQPSRHREITYVNVFCRVGSALEPANLRGVSHFIEHMCFKGTKQLPNTKDIFEVYDDIGAYFNAYTEKQYTCYVSTFDNLHIKKCISTMGDMLFHSKFNKQEYDKELNVVIEENVRNLTDYKGMMLDIAESSIYKGSTYSFPVDSMKYHKIVNAWNYQDVIDFYHTYYVPENMLLSIVSSVPFHTIISIIQSSYFAKEFSRKSHKSSPTLNPQPIMQLEPQHDIRIQLLNVPHIKSAYISVGFRTCSLFNEDKYALELLQTLFGGKFTSRLTTVLREKHGLTYNSNVSTTYYENSGDFIIYAITDCKKVMYNYKHSRKHTRTHHVFDKRKTAKLHRVQKSVDNRGVLPIIVDSIRHLIKHGVYSAELHSSKTHLNGNMLMNASVGETQVDYNGKEWFLGNNEKIVPYTEKYHLQYAPLNVAKINQIIRKYFTPENLSVVIVGGHLPDKSQILKCCKHIFT